ncbi:MAG: hypothetical protein GXO79_05565 [Chlorobi bacterium]|nr:hypothetical protein [Chlorobiota bacterium]
MLFKLSIVTVILVLFSNCTNKFIDNNMDDSKGFNGSFEIINNGYPVNWLIFKPAIQKGNVNFIIDTIDAKQGKNCILLDAKKVSGSSKAWKKPGMENQFKIKPGVKYKLSLWLKNENSSFYVSWITATKDKKRHLRSKKFIETEISFSTWYYFKEIIEPAENEELLLLDIVMDKPGKLWIDDVNFEELIDSVQYKK